MANAFYQTQTGSTQLNYHTSSTTPADFNQFVYTNANGESVTNSRIVADVFDKRHADVIRSIENLDCSKDFAQRNFASGYYYDSNNQARKQYEIKRDGLIFLVAGFTGSAAAKLKEDYIAAFNLMEEKLRNPFGNLQTITQNPDFIIQIGMQMKSLQESNQRLLADKKYLEEKNDKLHSDNVMKSIQIQRNADKVDFANTVSSASNVYLFREAIKAVNSTIKEADLRKLMVQDRIIYTKTVMGQNEYHSYASHKERFYEHTHPLANGINKTTLKFRASSLEWLNSYIKKNIHRIQ